MTEGQEEKDNRNRTIVDHGIIVSDIDFNIPKINMFKKTKPEMENINFLIKWKFYN